MMLSHLFQVLMGDLPLIGKSLKDRLWYTPIWTFFKKEIASWQIDRSWYKICLLTRIFRLIRLLFLKGKAQLDPTEVVHIRRVASKRIHVERVIGYLKGSKSLKVDLSSCKVPLGSRIPYVCFAIANFRNCIVNKHLWLKNGNKSKIKDN